MEKFKNYKVNEDRYDNDYDYDDDRPAERPIPKKEKPKKEKKVFNVGDVLMCIKTKQGKLPYDAYEFLLTYKKFTVKSISEKGNLDLGCKISKNDSGVEKTYLFSPNRFELESLVKAGKVEINNDEDDDE